ncbi:MAG: hypothetical protein HY821_16175 [Acidobacteria bacterium]|nr:hypothetical protein [Acidobacteriota bacterium]
MSIKNSLRIFGLACLAASALCAQAPSGANEANLKALVDAARKDLKTEKQAMIDQAMKLDAGDKAKFWGVYAGFQKELDAIWDTRIANIKKYADTYQAMTDAVADQLASSALNNEAQLTALKKKYHAQFKAALGAKAAARWLQAETTIGNVMMLQLLSEIPLLQ